LLCKGGWKRRPESVGAIIRKGKGRQPTVIAENENRFHKKDLGGKGGTSRPLPRFVFHRQGAGRFLYLRINPAAIEGLIEEKNYLEEC